MFKLYGKEWWKLDKNLDFKEAFETLVFSSILEDMRVVRERNGEFYMEILDGNRFLPRMIAYNEERKSKGFAFFDLENGVHADDMDRFVPVMQKFGKDLMEQRSSFYPPGKRPY